MTSQRKGIVLTLMASAGAACFLTSYKVAATLGDRTDAVLVMLTAAAVFNSMVSAWQVRGHSTLRLDRLAVLLSLVLSGLTLLGNHLALQAVARISAPLTSVMQQTQLLFVGLLGSLLLGESVTFRFWVGAAIAAAGLVLLNLSGDAGSHIEALGTMMAVGSAACFAAMALLTRKYIRRIHPIQVNALRLWMSVALWFVIERRGPGPVSVAFVLACASAALFGPFLSRTALMYALRHIPASQSTLVGLATPVVTLLPGFVVFGTIPNLRECLGSAIMIAGIALPLVELSAMSAASPLTGAPPPEEEAMPPPST